MSIYDIDFVKQSADLLPPDKRQTKLKSFVYALCHPVQILRDLFHDDYADGFTGSSWDSLLSYNPGDKVRYIDKSVYECQVFSGPGVLPTNLNFWVKVQDNYIGLRERLKYNSQKILLEFILNKWFDVPPPAAPQIYIQNNNIYGNGFLLGQSGGTSGTMPNNSIYQEYYLGESYTFGQYSFTVFVPTAIFSALNAHPLNAENIIRAIVDKYVVAGNLYDVQQY